jgi:hypothetical protein
MGWRLSFKCPPCHCAEYDQRQPPAPSALAGAFARSSLFNVASSIAVLSAKPPDTAQSINKVGHTANAAGGGRNWLDYLGIHGQQLS